MNYIFKCNKCGKVTELACDYVLSYEQRSKMRCGEGDCGGKIHLTDVKSLAEETNDLAWWGLFGAVVIMIFLVVLRMMEKI